MSDTVVRVEHLGKKYKLMHQRQAGYTTLREQLTQTAKKVGNKFDKFDLIKYKQNS